MSTSPMQMPKKVEIEPTSKSANFGRFILQPLEKGYGVTIGNSFRRVLLSSMPGQAFTAVRFDGVLHEFSTIHGVSEDVSEIILNLKQVRMRLNDKKITHVEVSFKGKREVVAGDITTVCPDIEILNPDHHLATLTSADSQLTMYLTVGRGKGYVVADDNKSPDAPVGTIAIDSIYTPIKTTHYLVEATRVGQQTDFEKLIIDVETDGSITPEEALVTAGKILREHIQLIISLSGEQEQKSVSAEEVSELQRVRKLLLTPIEDIELSVRSRNCLQAANIKTIGELVSRDESELLNVRNFGRKSLGELSTIAQEMGLKFGMDVKKILGETE